MSCLLHQVSFGVKSVVSSDPSALVFCSCFLACFAPLLLLVGPELQKGMASALLVHWGWAIEEADKKVPGVTCSVYQCVDGGVFWDAHHFSFLFIAKRQASDGIIVCWFIMGCFCSQPPCHDCFQPIILDSAIRDRFVSQSLAETFTLLDLQYLKNTLKIPEVANRWELFLQTSISGNTLAHTSSSANIFTWNSSLSMILTGIQLGILWQQMSFVETYRSWVVQLAEGELSVVNKGVKSYTLALDCWMREEC